MSLKISPLEVSLGFLVIGTFLNNASYTDIGLAIYQSFYIEPIKFEKYKDVRTDSNNI